MDLATAVKGGPRRTKVRLLFDQDVRDAFNDAADRAAQAAHLPEDDPEREAAIEAVREADRAYDEALTAIELQALPVGDYADLLDDYTNDGKINVKGFQDALVVASLSLPDGVTHEQVRSICADGQWAQLVEAAVNLNRGGDVVGKSDAAYALIRAIQRKSGTPPSAESAGANGAANGRTTTKPTRSRGSSKRT